MRNIIARSLLPLVISMLVISCSDARKDQVNFVIIQLDDLGYDDLGIHGNTLVETPNIDSLGHRSMRFNQFYVNPLGAPTRASLLTGRHFLRTGVSHVRGKNDLLNRNETTFAERLSHAGYATGMWGKWQSGHAPGYYPWERGFDEAYMANLSKHHNSTGWFNGQPVEHNRWADQVIAGYAIDFISRNRDTPFLAYLSFLSPHAPLEAPDSLVKKYTGKGLSVNLAALYGMVEHSDHYIGKVIQAIDTMELTEKTMILFLSDNGPAVLDEDLSDEDRAIRGVNKLKGHKGNIWENGVKSPLFVHWQGVTQPVISYELVDVTDIYPTLLSFAGIAHPDSLPPLDGEPFCELVRCGTVSERNKISYNYSGQDRLHEPIHRTSQGVPDEYRPMAAGSKAEQTRHEQVISVRRGTFKLMHNPDPSRSPAKPVDGYVLVDVLADPTEEYNLYEQLPETARELKSLLQGWWQSIILEPGSFNAPTFSVGGTDEPVTTVPAKAPYRTGTNNKSASSRPVNRTRPGDFAEYRVNVKTPGTYLVTLIFEGDPSGAEIRISSGEKSVSNVLTSSGESLMGHLELNRRDTLLRIELIKNGGDERAFEKLHAVELQKQ